MNFDLKNKIKNYYIMIISVIFIFNIVIIFITINFEKIYYY